MYIEKTHTITFMDKDNPPVARCASGEVVTFQTKDCFSELIQKDSDMVHTVPARCHNPATGPLYVEGAEPGDVLKVDIQKIAMADHGAQAIAPGDGPMGGHIQKEYTHIFPVHDGYVEYNDLIRIPICPMIGVIGTAPAGDPVVTITPGDHGSNMDDNKICEGTTLYLPVNVPGALLAMGDLHAVMGNGEVSGYGVEVSGEVTVKVTVVKGARIPTPLLRTADEYSVLGVSKTIDDAMRAACEKMHAFLGEATTLDEYERITLLSLVGNTEICQVVNPTMSVRMTVPIWVVDKYGYQLP